MEKPAEDFIKSKSNNAIGQEVDAALAKFDSENPTNAKEEGERLREKALRDLREQFNIPEPDDSKAKSVEYYQQKLEEMQKKANIQNSTAPMSGLDRLNQRPEGLKKPESDK